MMNPSIARHLTSRKPRSQNGVALIIVLGIMSIVLVVAAISVRLTLLAERSSRNDRDRQVAFQAAEAALADAELDIMGPNSAANRRCDMNSREPESLQGRFVDLCGTSTADKNRGLCAANADAAKPLYKQVNFENTDESTRAYATLGEFTGRSAVFKKSGDGGLSASPPKYIIEMVRYFPPVSVNGKRSLDSKERIGFLVTAVGYGASSDTRVMLQGLIFKPLPTPGC